MSILSAQIEKLRKAAQTYRTLGNHELEQLLLDAADTIWELRDDLQRANDAVRDAEHDESRAWDRVRKVEAENVKLRELVRGLHAAYVGMISQYEGGEESLILEYSSSIETDIDNLQSECDEARHRFDAALRELGVEVDG